MAVENVLRSIFSMFFLVSLFRISTPIIFPAMGGLIAASSGVSNMALEGIMNASALTGVLVSVYTKNLGFSILCGIAVGVAIAGILAFFHLKLNTTTTLAGLALNLFCSGGTVFAMYIITGDKGNTSNLASLAVQPIHIPIIKDIPFLGQILSGHWIFTYLAFFSVWVIYMMLYRTPFGMHLRAVGENPDAATSLGINVNLHRTIALLMSGVMASLGGMTLSMAYLYMFQAEMAAGRGWIGLVSVSLGARKPVGVLLAAMLFGFSDSLSNQLGSLKVPSMLVQTIPYITTVVALVVYAIQQRQEIINRVKKFQEQHAAANLAAAAESKK